ncbi:MAG: D-glycero-beta-D-manno-heptose 1-phosphate adenylyltransferase [bacterium]
MRQKILDLTEALEMVERAKAQGKRIVFTNGCFDILHAGHVEYLQKAREMGDLLAVGINSDSSVRNLKGPGRPVFGLEERCLVLAALACVDMVIPFEEPDPLNLIELLKPHVLVKGADWAEESIVGAESVRSQGGEVKTIPLRPMISTSLIIQRILERFGSSGS